MVEDGGTILGPLVTELPTWVRRMDVPPIEFQELAVGDSCWIVDDLDRLSMSRFACRHFLIARVLLLAPRIARSGRDHAVHRFENLLHAPEAATGERRLPQLAIARSRINVLRGGGRRCEQHDAKDQAESDSALHHR